MRVHLREAWPGVFRVDSGYDVKLNAYLKTGIRWFDFNAQLGRKSWYIPKERIEETAEWLRTQGHEVIVRGLPLHAHDDHPSDTLEPHQREAVMRLLASRVLLLQGDTGTGKTLVAIEAHRHLPVPTIVVCPRTVIPNWVKECEKWGIIEEPTEIRSGRKIPEKQPPLTLVSYGMLKRLPAAWGYNLIVFDELHNAMHDSTRRAKAAVDLVLTNPQSYRLGLTGTPVSTQLHDIYHQMHVLCPHRWGTFYQWTERFHLTDKQGYNMSRRVRGLNPARRDEFLATVAAITQTVSQADLGAAFPAVSWHVVGGPVDEVCKPSPPPETLKAWQKEQTKVIDRRIAAVQALNVPLDRPVAFVTYLRETAERLAESLGIGCITGKMPAHKRMGMLDQNKPFAATMMSINEGLSLPQYTRVYLVESYPVPRFVEQVIGRFVRLHEKAPVEVNFLRLAGTSDTVITSRLCARLEEQADLIRKGTIRKGLADTLVIDHNSDEFLSNLRDALMSTEEDEGDGWG